MPPNTNKNRNQKKYSIGVSNEIFPRRNVAVQVTTLMAEKMAVNIDRMPKIPESSGEMPATNMWWPQVRKPTNAMPSEEYAMARYDAGRLCENVHTTSDITAMAGKIMMYTAGCE